MNCICGTGNKKSRPQQMTDWFVNKEITFRVADWLTTAIFRRTSAFSPFRSRFVSGDVLIMLIPDYCQHRDLHNPQFLIISSGSLEFLGSALLGSNSPHLSEVIYSCFHWSRDFISLRYRSFHHEIQLKIKLTTPISGISLSICC